MSDDTDFKRELIELYRKYNKLPIKFTGKTQTVWNDGGIVNIMRLPNDKGQSLLTGNGR